MNRLYRHLLFAGLAGPVLLILPLSSPQIDLWEGLSIASAWLSMVALCAAMLIGPIRHAAAKPVPLNIYLRRDLGIWSAGLAFVHFYAGTVVSMDPVYIQVFVSNAELAPGPEVRDQLFVWGSIAGTVVAILFLLLLAISSDRAIRWLGPVRWKKVQRCIHPVLWLTVLHGIAFQILEARFVPLVLLVGLALLVYFYRFKSRRAV